ncbi:MAG: MBL fold metallo-hydrolase [Spirochaetaceae bacterium]|jgi:glyoxylase-like metal-dependent hydrolase (beta-lactamase superfamily II)|nr:MBL fold metallo-hydrolase [Spirochaetaceae bacterium]
MKVYFHFSLSGFSNSYLVSNEENGEALIIDPGKITMELINNIEKNKLNLAAVLVTHNHPSHCQGIPTLMKLYTPKIYAVEAEVAEQKTIVLKEDGILKAAGLSVGFLSVPGHSSDSVAFKIGRILFTGDALMAGLTGSTNNAYSRRTLEATVQGKILSQDEDTLLMPGHGPPTSVGAEKRFNLTFSSPVGVSG